MLTQCPSCQTVFRVTSTILRAAHGQVRCGRCNTQFDAIEQLQDSEDGSTPNDTEAGATDKASTEYESTPLSHEDIVLEGNRIEISGVYRRPDDQSEDDTASHTHTIIEEFNIGTEEWENPFARHEDIESEDDEATEAELEDIEEGLSEVELADAIASLDTGTKIEPATHSDTKSAAPADTARAALANTRTQPLPVAAPEAPTTHSTADALLDEQLFANAPQPRRWPWLIASVSLSLLLMVQAVHHARAELARHPSIGPQLGKLYAAIGQPLAPQWQLQAYSIKQWGIVSDPQEPNTLRVRASVTNGASFAQPYPLLHLSLEDRFGGKVGTRDFKPEEYLSSQPLATRLLGAGEAANIDLAIVDPGQEAVGFQFDTCLQLADHDLQCTHDLPMQQP